jgi:hypothetical protein
MTILRSPFLCSFVQRSYEQVREKEEGTMRYERRWLTAGLGLVLALAAGAATARGQEGGIPVPKPTKEHALFQKDLGTWDAAVKSWMAPNAEPVASKGTETNTLLPGGLWMLSEFKGSFGGMDFHGRGQSGFDPSKKKYVATWIDSFSTNVMTMEGSYDEATHTITMTGDALDMTGKPAKMKNVTNYKPDGTRAMTMFMKSEATGPDFVKVMEINYTKKGDAK